MKERLRKFNKVSNFKILALCVLLIAGIMYYYEEVRAVEIERVPTVEVVVLRNDVSENAVITEEMVSLELRYSDRYLKEADVARKVEDVVGKRTRVPLYGGELISSGRLLEDSDCMDKPGTEISLQIGEIERALNIKKGDYIDIWATAIVSELNPSFVPTYKVFEKVRVSEIVNSGMRVIDASEEFADVDDVVPLYLVIKLDDEDIVAFYNIDRDVSSIKFSKYSENEYYSISDKIDRSFDEGLEEKIGEEENTEVEVGDEDEQGIY
jgi:hypothetical protein